MYTSTYTVQFGNEAQSLCFKSRFSHCLLFVKWVYDSLSHSLQTNTTTTTATIPLAHAGLACTLETLTAKNALAQHWLQDAEECGLNCKDCLFVESQYPSTEKKSGHILCPIFSFLSFSFGLSSLPFNQDTIWATIDFLENQKEKKKNSVGDAACRNRSIINFTPPHPPP